MNQGQTVDPMLETLAEECENSSEPLHDCLKHGVFTLETEDCILLLAIVQEKRTVASTQVYELCQGLATDSKFSCNDPTRLWRVHQEFVAGPR